MTTMTATSTALKAIHTAVADLLYDADWYGISPTPIGVSFESANNDVVLNVIYRDQSIERIRVSITREAENASN